MSLRHLRAPAALAASALAFAVGAAGADAAAYCVANATPACPASFDAGHTFTHIKDIVADNGVGPLAAGDTVMIEPGTYAENPDLTGRADVTVFGDPAHAERPLVTGASNLTFHVGGGAAGGTLRHLAIEATRPSGGLAFEDELASGDKLTLDDVTLTSTGTCASLDGDITLTGVAAHQTTSMSGNPCLEVNGARLLATGLAVTADTAATAAVFGSGDTQLDHVDIAAKGTTNLSFPAAAFVASPTSSVSHARISGTTIALAAFNFTAPVTITQTVTDSVLTATGPAAAIGPSQLTDGGVGYYALGAKATLRNVTAVATGGGSSGVQAAGTSNFGYANVPPAAISATNAIARGEAHDAYGGPPVGCSTDCKPGSVALDHADARRSDGDGTTAGAGVIAADPLFVSAATQDFHLQAGSPAIAVGAPVPAGTTDLDGAARSASAPDLGGYEVPAARKPLPPAAGGTPVTKPPPAPAGPIVLPPAKHAPRLTLTRVKRSLRTIRSSKGFLISVACDETCAVTATVKLGKRTAGTGRRTIAAGRGALVRVRLSKAALRRLRHRHSAVFTVGVAASAQGLSTTRTLRITAR